MDIELSDSPLLSAPGVGELSRAKLLLTEALELDEAGEREEALEQYKLAVEVCLKARLAVTEPDLKEKLNKVARQALDRAESLSSPELESQARPRVVRSLVRPLGGAEESDKAKAGGGRGGYSEEEIKVLKATSVVNRQEYLPFISADLRERFAFPVAWTDPAGRLALSPKQRQRLKAWARPDEIMARPVMIQAGVDCYSVKQTLVSDCSFVASIAIAALYEKKYAKRLVTGIIFPQNKAGEPVYNPCGKYMVKLHINGVARKVIVDDYFPIGSGNELLCSYSSNKSELWISLLEKAYMKVMGGYDFPGSNSNIDLFALTGWIPERVSLSSVPGSSDTFSHLLARLGRGQCLATVATGQLSDAVADRAGLVSTHAYAVLDVVEVEGVRLVKLKNPWSHLRWRGNWSELDTQHWTPTFRRALNYDPEDAANFDNGVFWIDWKSLLHYFDVLYMNWDPGMFRHSTSLQGAWAGSRGPAKDLISMGDNPQYRLDLLGDSWSSQGGAVWLLLSRHITDIGDFRDNKEYITLLVYKNEGKKVYYPYDPPPFIEGIRINSPHYLTKIILNKGENLRRLTVVVSQFEKTSTIYFSIKAFSTLPFSLEKIKTPWRHKEEVTGRWAAGSAGGCANNKDSWASNPRYQLELDSPGQIHIQLKGPKQYQIGFDLLTVSTATSDKSNPQYFSKKSSGLYRSGFTVFTVEAVAGVYDIVPSTFSPAQEGPFFLLVASSSSFKLTKTR